MGIKSVFIIIGGRVQGVGFRYFARQKAIEFNISGWVKNAPDGNVEIEATGNLSDLNTFTEWMKSGPTRAIVSTFSITEIIPVRNDKSFIIR